MKKFIQPKVIVLFLFVLTFCFLTSGGILAEEKEPEKPKLIKKVNPVYPEEARKEGIEGTVVLEATTGIYGKVKKLKVLKGKHDILNKAAVEAVKQWVYEPMLKDGKPVPAEFTVAVRFRLNGDKDCEEDPEKVAIIGP